LNIGKFLSVSSEMIHLAHQSFDFFETNLIEIEI
jgi:hypothetical protein